MAATRRITGGAAARGLHRSPSSDVRRPLDAAPVRRGSRRHRAPAPSTRPVRRDHRDVGLAVARVDGQHAGAPRPRPSRPRRGARGCARSAGRSGRRRGRPGRPAGGPAAPRRPGRRPPCSAASSARCSYAVTCARPARRTAGPAARPAAASAPVRADRRRHLDDRVVGQERQRAVVADVDHLDVRRRSPQQRRRQVHGGLGVERAAALAPAAPASRRAPGRRTSPAARCSIAATSAARDGCVAQLARPPRRGRRSSAGSTTGPRRGGRSRPGGSSQVARRSSSPCSASSSGSTSLAVGPQATARSQVRWLSPTWSSWTVVGRHARAVRRTAAGSRSRRCTARPPGARPPAGRG